MFRQIYFRILAISKPKPPVVKQPTQSGPVRRETWDWVSAMLKVARMYRGEEGKVVPFGDSITYANQAGRWARFGKGKSAEENKICNWMKTGRNDASNGWWLAADDQAKGRSWTAASGVTSGQYIKGGKHGLPSLDEIIKAHNPQIALILLGTNDLSANVPTSQYLANMETIYKRCLQNGTIPVVETVPPTTWDKGGRIDDYNEGLIKLAAKYKLPLLDVYGEFLARRPGNSWKGTLKEIIYLKLFFLAQPFAAMESWMRRGATLTVYAQLERQERAVKHGCKYGLSR